MSVHERDLMFPDSVPAAAIKRKGRSQPSMTWACVKPDGRCCKICGESDKAEDHVICESSLRWGYPPKDGRSQGDICYYCARIHQCRWKPMGVSISALITKLGAEEALLIEFMDLQKKAVQQMQTAGRHDIVFKRAAAGGEDDESDRRLDTVSGKKVEIFQPDDSMYEMKHYKTKYGDPKKNGLNHKVTMWKGKEMVLVPGEPVYKVKRSEVATVEVREKVNTGANCSMGCWTTSWMTYTTIASWIPAQE